MCAIFWFLSLGWLRLFKTLHICRWHKVFSQQLTIQFKAAQRGNEADYCTATTDDMATNKGRLRTVYYYFLRIACPSELDLMRVLINALPTQKHNF